MLNDSLTFFNLNSRYILTGIWYLLPILLTPLFYFRNINASVLDGFVLGWGCFIVAAVYFVVGDFFFAGLAP